MREHKLSRATSIVCVSAMISFIVCSCTTPQTLTLHYDTPAQYFEEALPIGNGRLGAMVYSRGNEDVLTLNDITLWTGEPENNAQHIDKVQNRLISRGCDKAVEYIGEDSWKELCERDDIDLVYISTPLNNLQSLSCKIFF